MKEIEKWRMLELTFTGKKDGNPYTDYSIKAVFTGEHETVEVNGFYDGDGIYKVRFMPSYEGSYHYLVQGDFREEHGSNGENMSDDMSGEFIVQKNRENNHGPVQVKDNQYLVYADGTPYFSMGTTCYAWVNQPENVQEQTLETLKNSCFNKIRFCIFPKYYQYNEDEPITYPYERGNKRGQDAEKEKIKPVIAFAMEKPMLEITDFDCYSFNTEHFKRFDKRISELLELGIEADIILFHPYDKWGFIKMNKECNELYLNYMMARFGAYRNVWWSLANEYDLAMSFSIEEWDSFGNLIKNTDPYHHLCSIHNCMAFYDYTKDWITHCSMQKNDHYKHVEETDIHLEKYKKPVVWDEIGYEGNIDMGWGNISGQEMVRRFWETTLRGGYAGHGETYVHPENILWWSHGDVLHGDSEPRIAFLKKIWQEVPGGFWKKAESMFDEIISIPVGENKTCSWMGQTWCDYELHYYGSGRPSYRMFKLPETESYQIDVIDTWNMTITNAGVHNGQTRIELPGHEWMAIRLQRMKA